MKILLAILTALFIGVKANAQAFIPTPPYNTTPTSEQYRSTFTCFGVSVSSYDASHPGATTSATAIFATTNTIVVGLNGSTVTVTVPIATYRKVNIQNMTASANVFISDNIYVSTFSVGQNGFMAGPGWEIPGVSTGPFSWTTPLVPGQQLYGTNDSGSKKAYLTVCPGY